MKWKLAALLIYMVPAIGSAEVQALKVADPGKVKARCEDAFDQIYKERKAIEGQEHFACIAVIPSSDITTIKAAFMVRCETKAHARLEYSYGKAITIDVEDLREAFNDDNYNGILAQKCASVESKRIAAQKAKYAGREATSSAGGGRGMSEAWYRQHGQGF